MLRVSDIDAVSVTLEADEKQLLFVLLAADGTINRLGTGEANNKDNSLFIGITREPLFDQLMTNLDDDMLGHMAGYEVPDQRGMPCKLSIALSFTNAEDNGFAFRYGSESQGPPDDICEFVTVAVQLTDRWFEQQKEMVNKSQSNDEKPWWKLW